MQEKVHKAERKMKKKIIKIQRNIDKFNKIRAGFGVRVSMPASLTKERRSPSKECHDGEVGGSEIDNYLLKQREVIKFEREEFER